MNILKKLFKYYLLIISIFFIGRVALSILYYDQIIFTDNFLLTLIYGLKMDTIIACIFLVIPAILMCFALNNFKIIIDKLLRFYFLIALKLEAWNLNFFRSKSILDFQINMTLDNTYNRGESWMNKHTDIY